MARGDWGLSSGVKKKTLIFTPSFGPAKVFGRTKGVETDIARLRFSRWESNLRVGDRGGNRAAIQSEKGGDQTKNSGP